MKAKTAICAAAIGLAVFVPSAPCPGQAPTVYDDGTTYVLDSVIRNVEVRNDPVSGDPTTLNIVAGATMDFVYTVQVFDESLVNVFGGTLDGNIHVWESGEVNIAGGSLSGRGHVGIHNDARATISGGYVKDFFAGDSAQATISGGGVGFLTAHEASHITVSGGEITGVGYIYLGDSVNLSGSASTMSFVGPSFTIDGAPVPHGEYGGHDFAHGLLAGSLADGGYVNQGFYVYGNSRFIFAPEPATLLLLALGGLVLVKRRRRQ